LFAFLGLFNKHNYCRSTPLWHTRKQLAGKNNLAYFVQPSTTTSVFEWELVYPTCELLWLSYKSTEIVDCTNIYKANPSAVQNSGCHWCGPIWLSQCPNLFTLLLSFSLSVSLFKFSFLWLNIQVGLKTHKSVTKCWIFGKDKTRGRWDTIKLSNKRKGYIDIWTLENWSTMKECLNNNHPTLPLLKLQKWWVEIIPWAKWLKKLYQ